MSRFEEGKSKLDRMAEDATPETIRSIVRYSDNLRAYAESDQDLIDITRSLVRAFSVERTVSDRKEGITATERCERIAKWPGPGPNRWERPFAGDNPRDHGMRSVYPL